MTWGSTWFWDKVFYHWGKTHHLYFYESTSRKKSQDRKEKRFWNCFKVKFKLRIIAQKHGWCNSVVLGCWTHKSFWYLVHGIDRIQSHISCTQHNTCTKTICTKLCFNNTSIAKIVWQTLLWYGIGMMLKNHCI